MRSVGYSRVSTGDQVEGYSLDAQERMIRERSESEGMELTKIYREEGVSAHTDDIEKRPEFSRLLKDAEDGLFEVVICHTLDRFSRSLLVLLQAKKRLEEAGVDLVFIVENIDGSTPQGKLVLSMNGMMSEHASATLGIHTRKGISQRAKEGRLLGSIPFGYMNCWRKDRGEKVRICIPEHPGGVHPVKGEAEVVRQVFERYATGAVNSGDLAAFLNDKGFRTRNTKKLRDGSGKESPGPKFFTRSSVRGLLKNPVYYGKVRHGKELYDGLHEPIISEDLFNNVRQQLSINNGRTGTPSKAGKKTYLLQGVVRCAYCLLPMWSQTAHKKYPIYREHRQSRSITQCPSAGGSIRSEIVDKQIESVIRALVLPDDWKIQIEKAVGEKSRAFDVAGERKKIQEKRKRLADAYTDGLIEEAYYQGRKNQFSHQMASLITPELGAAEEAGRLLERLTELWEGANLEERHRLITLMFDSVFVDHKKEKRIVCIRPRAEFRPVMRNIKTKKNSGIFLTLMEDKEIEAMSNALQNCSEGHLCSWWRRGRVELPVQKTPRSEYTTGLVGP